jgi:hypothetical protein
VHDISHNFQLRQSPHAATICRVQVLAIRIDQKTEFVPKLTILRFVLGGILQLYGVLGFQGLSGEWQKPSGAMAGASLLFRHKPKYRIKNIG